MQRFNPIIGDPVTDSAALLRRLAFFLLFMVLPITAIIGRRALVIIVPIAIALLVISALLDGNHLPLGQNLKRFFLSPAALTGLLFILWSALSLLWSPFPDAGIDRLVDSVTTVALIFVGYLALPERMRTPNLHLLPLGVCSAAILAIVAEFFLLTGSQSPELADIFQRGLQVSVLLFWPSLAWLRSRHRDIMAVGLVVIMAVALLYAPQHGSLIAFGIGAAGYVSVMFFSTGAVLWIARITAAILAFAPLLPFVLQPVAAVSGSVTFAASLKTARKLILSEPMQVIAGQGFESTFLAKTSGMLASAAPSSVLFKLWYELGIIGAWSVAALILMTIGKAGSRHLPLAPGMAAGFLSAYVFACTNYGVTQAWWATALASTILVFIAVTRGPYRATRPRIFVVR